MAANSIIVQCLKCNKVLSDSTALVLSDKERKILGVKGASSIQVHENLDPDLLQEEAHDLFESWWASTHSQGQWNAEVKQRTWDSIWREFGNGSKR